MRLLPPSSSWWKLRLILVLLFRICGAAALAPESGGLLPGPRAQGGSCRVPAWGIRARPAQNAASDLDRDFQPPSSSAASQQADFAGE
jgi:hypothetical protein